MKNEDEKMIKMSIKFHKVKKIRFIISYQINRAVVAKRSKALQLDILGPSSKMRDPIQALPAFVSN